MVPLSIGLPSIALLPLSSLSLCVPTQLDAEIHMNMSHLFGCVRSPCSPIPTCTAGVPLHAHQLDAENYMNISHQTLEVMRFAAADPAVTHVLKVGSKGGGGRNREMKGTLGWTGK